MSSFDAFLSPSNIRPLIQSKNYEHPLTKLTNMAEIRCNFPSQKSGNVLIDRSNEIYLPKNASKFVQETFDPKINRQREIEQIRKKYYENPIQKGNIIASHNCDHNVHQDRELKTHTNAFRGFQINSTLKYSVLQNNQVNELKTPIQYNKPLLDPQKLLGNSNLAYKSNYDTKFSEIQRQINQKFQNLEIESRNNCSKVQRNKFSQRSVLDKISQASNSNNQTFNKTYENLSPSRTCTRSLFIVQSKSSKKMNESNQQYYNQSVRNKENQPRSIIKQTISVYNESAAKGSHPRQKETVDSEYLERGSSLYCPKPFTIEDSKKEQINYSFLKHPFEKSPLDCYPTAYDNLILNNYQTSTVQKEKTKQEEHFAKIRPRTSQLKYLPHKIDESSKNHEKAKIRIVKFQDDEKVNQIERRLKQRQVQFMKREKQLKNKCDNLHQKNPEIFQADLQINGTKNPQTRSKINQNKDYSQQYNQRSFKPNVQREIERLSLKIKQFQNKKKQLNLLPKATQIQQNHKKPLQTIYQFQKARKDLQQYRCDQQSKKNQERAVQHFGQIISEPKIKFEEELDYEKRSKRNSGNQGQSTNKSGFIQKTKPIYSERTMPASKANQSSCFAFKLFKIESEPEQTSPCTSKATISSITSKTNAKQCQNQFEIHRRTDDGIEQRKKRLQENPIKNPSQQIKKLVSLFSQQAILDQQFRNCKIWFHNQRSKNKWHQLKRQLRQCKLTADQHTETKDEVITEFLLCQDENNPFFSVNQHSKFSYNALAKSFIASKNFWDQNIAKKFSMNSLRAEEFNLQKFDLEKKGFINIEDLVRFLNFESGNFYRNRDLILIFKRLLNREGQKQQKTLTVQNMLSVLAY